MGSQVLQGPRVIQAVKEVKEPKGQEDFQDQQEMQGEEVPWESWDKLDLKDLLESQEPQVEEECLVQMDPWVQKEHLETLDSQDLLVLRVNLVILVGQVFLGSKVLEESQEDQGDRDLGGPLERLETMVGMVRQVSQVCKGFLEDLVLWELQVTRV